jgi:hypothetical protein
METVGIIIFACLMSCVALFLIVRKYIFFPVMTKQYYAHVTYLFIFECPLD